MARVIIGKVTSDTMDKTIAVAVTSLKNHPIYRKKYKVTKKFLVHDEDNSAKVGDMVRFSETKPLSRRKRWMLEEIIERGVSL